MSFFGLKKKILRRIVGSSVLTYKMRNIILRQMGVILGEQVAVSSGFKLADRSTDRNLLRIGNRVDIAGNVTVLLATGPVYSNLKKIYPIMVEPVDIQDDVWIGVNAIILQGVTIGRGSIIGAGCVIHKDVPPFSVVTGNPMVVKRIPNSLIEDIEN